MIQNISSKTQQKSKSNEQSSVEGISEKSLSEEANGVQSSNEKSSIDEMKIQSREKTIDEMKIQTMYKMVEDIQISIEGRELERKVLYLTNKQCNMFDENGITKCMQALDLGNPKCVIRLMNSIGGVCNYSAHIELHGSEKHIFGGVQPVGSEICEEDAQKVNRQLDLFIKTSILPLAMQTNALIIISGSSDCSLAAAMDRVILPEQDRLGRNCPFKVLCFLWSFKYSIKY